MDQIDTKVTNLIEEIKAIFTDEKTAIELKRQEVQKLMKDKALLDQKDADLKAKEEDLEKREQDLKINIEKNRQRTETLDIREKKLDQEKSRIQNIMNGI